MSDLQEKLHTLASKLGLSQETPAAESNTKTTTWTEGQSGATVNWDEYDLDAEQVKLYRKAKFHEGEWLFPYVHYVSFSAPISQVSSKLEELVNGDDWKILTIQSNGSGMQAVILTRTTVHQLNTPVRLDANDSVPTDSIEDSANKWAETNRGSE